MSFNLDGPLVLVGAGKMGGALLAGWLDQGLDPDNVIVQDPAPPPEIQDLLSTKRIAQHADVSALGIVPAVLLMAVKPQMMDAVLAPLGRIANRNTLVLSIAAGRTIASFEKHLAADVPVVRAMPNTPAAIGRGITVCAANAAAGQASRDLATQLLEAVGEVAWIDDEVQIDAVTAVSGSGPAYVFLLAETLAAAGVKAGLDADLANRLARATVAGSGELLARSDLGAAELRRNVTSPGGTTAAALDVLMGEDALARLMEAAVSAAQRRGRELAG